MANKFWIEVKKLAKKWSKIVEDPYYTMDDFVDCLNFRSRDNSVDEINDEFYDLCEKYGVKFYAPEDYRGGNMLELSDRHVMWEIEIPEGLDPEEAENIIEDHINYGLHKFNDNHENARVGLYGRGSRHVCVPFTEWNLEDYFDLRDDMEKTIDKTIASINHALSYAATHQNESRLRRGRMLKESASLKYEITDETMEWRNGVYTLHRIRALKNFGDVKAGDLGGWIESENNLSQEGNCWVFDDAKVYDIAKVYGDAEVYGQATVYENAKVFEDAFVYGNAEVFGNARVYGKANVYEYAQVFENALVYDKAKVFGDAWVRENAKVDYDVSEGEITESRRPHGRMLKENRTILKVVSVEQIVLDCKTGEMLDGCDLQKRFVDAMVGRTFDGDENLVEYVVEEIFGLDYADKNLYDYMYNYEGDKIIVSACSRKDWCMEPVPEDDPRAYFEFQIHVGVDKILAERRR